MKLYKSEKMNTALYMGEMLLDKPFEEVYQIMQVNEHINAFLYVSY